MLAFTIHIPDQSMQARGGRYQGFLQVKDAQQGQGMNRAIIHTVDTDVGVLGVLAVARLEDLKLTIAL